MSEVVGMIAHAIVMVVLITVFLWLMPVERADRRRDRHRTSP